MLLERLSLQTGRSKVQLLDFGQSAGRKYKEYLVPKRSGGFRKIEQPSKSVKAVQRWLISSLFSKYPEHQAATGYKKGSSISANAGAHAKYRYTLRIDFKDFFWSFRAEDIENFLRNTQALGLQLSNDDIKFVVGAVCRQGRLVMGAPSSPIITNVMMYGLDSTISEACRGLGTQYTRYADDIYVSSNVPNRLREVEKLILRAIAQGPLGNLRVNEQKTCHLSKKYRRVVTGLVITTEGRVSLGRDRKRMIKALVHRASLDQCDSASLAQLSGYLNWASDVEPDFLRSLDKKYGSHLVLKLRNKNP